MMMIKRNRINNKKYFIHPFLSCKSYEFFETDYTISFIIPHKSVTKHKIRKHEIRAVNHMDFSIVFPFVNFILLYFQFKLFICFLFDVYENTQFSLSSFLSRSLLDINNIQKVFYKLNLKKVDKQ